MLFRSNPIVIEYSASLNSTITEISGSLPAGLRFDKTGFVLKILGICIPTGSDINAKFTLRLKQVNGTVADRTFSLNLTKLIQPPSWENQQTFLGYQNSVLPQAYTLHATVPPTEHVTYSIISTHVNPAAAVNVTINPQTGVLICDAANVVTNNTIITLGIRATSVAHSDISCTIEVITIPDAPEWITPEIGRAHV